MKDNLRAETLDRGFYLCSICDIQGLKGIALCCGNSIFALGRRQKSDVRPVSERLDEFLAHQPVATRDKYFHRKAVPVLKYGTPIR